MFALFLSEKRCKITAKFLFPQILNGFLTEFNFTEGLLRPFSLLRLQNYSFSFIPANFFAHFFKNIFLVKKFGKMPRRSATANNYISITEVALLEAPKDFKPLLSFKVFSKNFRM